MTTALIIIGAIIAVVAIGGFVVSTLPSSMKTLQSLWNTFRHNSSQSPQDLEQFLLAVKNEVPECEKLSKRGIAFLADLGTRGGETGLQNMYYMLRCVVTENNRSTLKSINRGEHSGLFHTFVADGVPATGNMLGHSRFPFD